MENDHDMHLGQNVPWTPPLRIYMREGLIGVEENRYLLQRRLNLVSMANGENTVKD